ncbi:MAG: hypothetical protein ABR879_07640 [Methanomassiliicoccales archaeon]|jgi:hypothetical protein
MTVDPLAIFVGVVGIGVVIALLLLIYKSESIKSRDRVAYTQKTRPYLLAFLVLTAALAVGLALVTDLPLALSLDLGLLVLAAGAIMMYLWPRGITGTDVRTSKWKMILATGVAMIVAGVAIQAMFPSGPDEAAIGPIPGALIGLGGLIAILSVVSFRSTENRG